MRGFLAGTVRKKLKLPLLSEKIDGVRTYRIGTAKAAKINKAKKTSAARKGLIECRAARSTTPL